MSSHYEIVQIPNDLKFFVWNIVSTLFVRSCKESSAAYVSMLVKWCEHYMKCLCITIRTCE
jgi:hypothetical protein